MQELQYVGETLWPRYIGHFGIILSFVSALFASFSYYKSLSSNENKSWRFLGRIGFSIHGISVLSIIGILAFVMLNRMYEYAYVSQHVSDDLPLKYTFSAFWEGQEGSFLLWMFWHVILGFILIRTSKKWESGVLLPLSLVQAILMSMILGIQFQLGEEIVKIGSNPLLLFRDTMDIPLFRNADYVSLLNGSGLNPLLQNYWMTIHPPTTFLGFASVTIPFCFAFAGYWKKSYKDWVHPALKWSLFSGGILGVGILMGGAWAYEALSFGGYWAWDPVENMSLVPWLLLIAGIHSLLIAKSTGRAINSSFIFLSLSFITILYSTFLTRSGILGETSVHAFTEMGLETQLLILILLFTGFSIYLYFANRKKVPGPEKEEKIGSREFWMFIGTVVLLFSSILITASTSLPIYNKIRELFNPGFEGLVIQDPVTHYNKYQIWIAVFIVLLSSVGQFFRYGGKWTESFKKKVRNHAILSVILTIAFILLTNVVLRLSYAPYFVLMCAGVFGIIANLDYFISFNKMQWKQSASILSHIGFSIMLIGIIASGVNKYHISSNSFAFRDIIPSERLLRNVQLLKDRPIFMSGYWVNYTGDTLIRNEKVFNVEFSRKDSTGKIIEEFELKPSAVYSNDFTEIVSFNPSTKHYLNKDIFSHIPGLPKHMMSMEYAQELEDTLKFEPVPLIANEPAFLDSLKVEFIGFDFSPEHPDYEPQENDLAIGINLKISSTELEEAYFATPVAVLRGAIVYKFHQEVSDLELRVRVNESLFEQMFLIEQEIPYQQIILKEGEETILGEIKISHLGFNREPENNAYTKSEGDIAVSSLLKFEYEGKETNLEPVYLIRNARETWVKDYDVSQGIHAKFTKIDPATGDLFFEIAIDDRSSMEIPLEIAQNAPRSDIIVLEAIVFPGINLFWAGSLLMLLGLFIGMAIRMLNSK